MKDIQELRAAWTCLSTTSTRPESAYCQESICRAAQSFAQMRDLNVELLSGHDSFHDLWLRGKQAVLAKIVGKDAAGALVEIPVVRIVARQHLVPQRGIDWEVPAGQRVKLSHVVRGCDPLWGKFKLTELASKHVMEQADREVVVVRQADECHGLEALRREGEFGGRDGRVVRTEGSDHHLDLAVFDVRVRHEVFECMCVGHELLARLLGCAVVALADAEAVLVVVKRAYEPLPWVAEESQEGDLRVLPPWVREVVEQHAAQHHSRIAEREACEGQMLQLEVPRAQSRASSAVRAGFGPEPGCLLEPTHCGWSPVCAEIAKHGRTKRRARLRDVNPLDLLEHLRLRLRRQAGEACREVHRDGLDFWRHVLQKLDSRLSLSRPNR
eukprot:m.260179 g.260179  ORF g.260179 m.260179 type:complete len:384 (+) comp23364_c0_seq1:160-1311(+)